VTIQEREELAKKLFEKCIEVLKAKGKDYEVNGDCLQQFKLIADLVGITPYQVWAVFWCKHALSILGAVKKHPEHPETTAEPLEGRVIDNINYDVCLMGLLKEVEKLDEGERIEVFRKFCNRFFKK